MNSAYRVASLQAGGDFPWGQISNQANSRVWNRRAQILIISSMLIININWEYFLAVIGTLIMLAYYANGRFTKLEISVEWLKAAIEALTKSTQSATHTHKSDSRFMQRSKVRGR